MNFLAGFLIITCADSVVAERGDESLTPTVSKRSDSATRGSKPHSETRGTSGASTNMGNRGSKGRDRGKANKERVMHLAEDEAEIIESECVEVMLGLVALQGGVLSRDLCGLHSVSEWR